MAELVSRRYSVALFELAVENNNVDALYNEAVTLVETLEVEKEFISIINHPEVTLEQKLELFKNIFGGKINDIFFGFFNIVLQKNREDELLNILTLFVDKCEEYKGIQKAHVVSAISLSETQINNIKNKISKNVNKEIRISTEVDSSLIGGVVIYLDGKVIDSSVKKYLDDQRKELLLNTK